MDRLTLERLDELLEAARGVRILVVGDLMLDRYLTGVVERISPEAPVPVVRVEDEDAAVGGAANVAANVVALGAACDVVGCVGPDPEGRALRRELEALGVGTAGVVEARDRPTTVKTRVVARHQQVVRYDREVDRDVPEGTAEELVRAVREVAPRCQVLVMEDYDKGILVPTLIGAVLEESRRLRRPTVVDPKRRHFFDFRGAMVFKPNAHELADALGEPVAADEPGWLEEARRRLGCEHLLVTLGEEGMALRSGDGTFVRVPAVARSVYDVSGAGDTVTAVVAVALGAGATVAEAAVMANYAAAVEVGKAGVAAVSPGELREEVERYGRGRTGE